MKKIIIEIDGVRHKLIKGMECNQWLFVKNPFAFRSRNQINHFVTLKRRKYVDSKR